MHTTLNVFDFLGIAAIVLLLARRTTYGSERGPTQQDLRMQRQLDAIMTHLGLPEPRISRPGALSPQVLSLLAAGRKIDAIRLYRQETGEDVRRARSAIDLHPGAR